MEHVFAKLLKDFEQGKMTRRQLIQSLAITATAATAAGAAPAATTIGKGFKAIYINHVSYQVADYAKTRDFYADLFGMKVSEDNGKQCRLSFGDNILHVRPPSSGMPLPSSWPTGCPTTPRVDHIAYTIANWDENKESVQAELKRRGLQVRGDTKTSFLTQDPDGLVVQLGGTHQ